MTWKTQILISALLALVPASALTAPPKPAPSKPAPKTVTVTEKETGKKIALKVGDKLVVRLKSNITTGYDWSGGKPSAVALKLVGRKYLSDPAPKGWTGVGGTTLYAYAAVKPGKAGVEYGYLRPWEKKPPVKTVRFAVVVANPAPKPAPKKP